MAKLSELRSQLRTGELDAKLEESQDQLLKRYKINAAGSDALIKFGRHRGLTLRQIGVSDPSYLDFILKEAFPEELKDVVRYIQAVDASDEIRRAAEDIPGPRDVARGLSKALKASSHSSLRGDKKR